MIWKVLKLEFQAGALDGFGLNWQQIERIIDIDVDAPTVASRDTLKKAQEDQIYVSLGVKSRETVQIEAGLDPELEKKRGAEAAQQPAPFGGQQQPMAANPAGSGKVPPDDTQSPGGAQAPGKSGKGDSLAGNRGYLESTTSRSALLGSLATCQDLPEATRAVLKDFVEGR
jgi:hypothetical protein